MNTRITNTSATNLTPQKGEGEHAPISRGDRQREIIIEATIRLLETHGVHEMTVKDITEAAGIKRPNFYFYFESKFDVLGEILTETWNIWFDRTGGFGRRPDESQHDYYARLGRAAFSTWLDHGDLMVAGLQAVQLDAQVRERWDVLIGGYCQDIARQLGVDSRAGLARPVSEDILGLVTILVDMNTFAYYQDRLRNATPAQSARTLESLGRVWESSLGF